MKEDANKSKNSKIASKQDKKPSPKTSAARSKPVVYELEKSKATSKPVKKTETRKTSTKAAKEIKTSAEKSLNKPISKTAIKKADKPLPRTEKTENSNQINDMSLPEGSALQQTGQRRPLIVFPK
ncbi:MAG: hypothetical protein FWC22_05340 [Treponema sp.]|nr:hypothetical protein [Treponema sp.]